MKYRPTPPEIVHRERLAECVKGPARTSAPATCISIRFASSCLRVPAALQALVTSSWTSCSRAFLSTATECESALAIVLDSLLFDCCTLGLAFVVCAGGENGRGPSASSKLSRCPLRSYRVFRRTSRYDFVSDATWHIIADAMPRYRTLGITHCRNGHVGMMDSRVLAVSLAEAQRLSETNATKLECLSCRESLLSVRVIGTEEAPLHPEYTVYGYVCRCGEKVEVFRIEVGMVPNCPASISVWCSRGHSRTVSHSEFLSLPHWLEKDN